MGSKGKGGGGGGGGGGGAEFLSAEERLLNFAQIPTSFGHELRACLRCRLVKTYDQFRESGCENCPFLEMDRDHDNVVNCTTPNFTGIISVMDPSRSWAARWLRIGRFIPGCYTLAVSEELPEEYQTICADNNVQLHELGLEGAELFLQKWDAVHLHVLVVAAFICGSVTKDLCSLASKSTTLSASFLLRNIVKPFVTTMRFS